MSIPHSTFSCHMTILPLRTYHCRTPSQQNHLNCEPSPSLALLNDCRAAVAKLNKINIPLKLIHEESNIPINEQSLGAVSEYLIADKPSVQQLSNYLSKVKNVAIIYIPWNLRRVYRGRYRSTRPNPHPSALHLYSPPRLGFQLD